MYCIGTEGDESVRSLDRCVHVLFTVYVCFCKVLLTLTVISSCGILHVTSPSTFHFCLGKTQKWYRRLAWIAIDTYVVYKFLALVSHIAWLCVRGKSFFWYKLSRFKLKNYRACHRKHTRIRTRRNYNSKWTSNCFSLMKKKNPPRWEICLDTCRSRSFHFYLRRSVLCCWFRYCCFR